MSSSCLLGSSYAAIFVFVSICIFEPITVNACAPTGTGTTGGTSGGTGTSGGGNGNGGVLGKKMGSLQEFGSVPPQDKFRVAKSGEELSCSSQDRSRGCCWIDVASRTSDNEPPEIDWLALAGTGDANKMRANFDRFTRVPPGPGVLAAYTEGAVPFSETAALESCVICLKNPDEPIRLSVEQWATSGTTLDACVTAADSFSPERCQSLDVGQQSVNIMPMNEPFRIVLRAGTFTDRSGSIVAIDNVQAASASRFSSCFEEPSVTTAGPPQRTPPPGASINCAAVKCGFDERSPCQYNTNAGGTTPWIVTDGLTGNMNTGVRRPSPKSRPFYIGANVPKRGKAIMKSGNIGATDGGEVRFQAYEATQNVILKACLDGESDCCWQSNPTVKFGDIRWMDAKCSLRPGTQQVWFIAENVGNQYGAAGIDDIQIFDASGRSVC